MRRQALFIITCLIALSSPVNAMGISDDPLLFKVMIDQFEIRSSDQADAKVWDAEAWIGKDINKLWIKSEAEKADNETEEAETQLLYSRAITPYWDIQVGWRHDHRPSPDRDWLAIAAVGVAPYFIDLDASLFIGGSGRSALRLGAEYELMLTQRLVLVPEVEINIHGKNDPRTGTGSGLSDIEAGIRLKYEFERQFAPYIGINWWQKFGNTQDYADEEGEATNDTQFVAGVSAWF